MIEFRNVSKVYDHNIRALAGVDFRVGKGEFVFVVGPSGAGKSTMLRMVYREELPSEGQVFVEGRDLARLRAASVPYLRRGIGVVFQDFKLLPSRTTFENVAFALEVTGARSYEIKRRTTQALELVGLRGRQRAYPHELSGGEQQRTSLARAVVNSPKILVADEPTGNLDPQTGRQLMQYLHNISLMGTTVLVATHARSIVDEFQCRVVRLERGRIVRDDQRAGYFGPLSACADGEEV
ncbi:MAG: cell division ATP-binding protein FtsE [Bacillota bacterium]|nr:cell division ATP-binding protein FtsE [Bacillota bacterium]